MTPIEWLSFAGGLVIVVGTSISVIKTLVVPRRAWSFLPHVVESSVTWLFMSIARRMRSYDLLDRFLGFLGPIVLIFTLLAWLAMLVIGFALMLAPSADDFPEALGQSGASTFTLGIRGTVAGSGTAISVAASATGLIVIALTIAYLPALYRVVSRRETLARQLGAHVGVQPWGPNVLLQYRGTGALDRLPELYSDWDQWANEVADGHTKYPVLNQFRLPRARCHWLLSLVAVLDAAGLDVSLRPSVSAGEARMFLRSATACADDLAASLRISETLDQDTVTEADFASAVALLTDAGYPVERSSGEAWPVFREWRAQYSTTSNRILDTIAAPPARWSGPRSLPTKRHPA
ncbi:MAG: hypothetical protein ACE1Z9_06430 [Acidimicrobiia bacterium]